MKQIGHATLRIIAGILFMEHGVQKLFGLMGGFGRPGATAPYISQYGVAGVLEFVGGVLIALGLFVRPTAFVLILEMIAAFATVHMPRGGWPVQNGGELALLYAIIFLFLVNNGAGPLSIDSIRRGRW